MVYLDNAATTQPKFNNEYGTFWYNPNQPYAIIESTNIDLARKRIKEHLNVNSGYVLFTRCATESIEWLANQFCTDEVWCSPYEHDSVYNVSNVLKKDRKQWYDIQDYSLYCHQLVNPITGATFNLKAIHDEYITRENQYFGVDYTAAIGHIDLPEDVDEYVDAIWFSGHKFHAPKGIGCLWVSNRLFEFLGGNEDPKNQYGLIHGTLSMPLIINMERAMKEAVEKYDACEYHSLFIYLMNEIEEQKIGKIITPFPSKSIYPTDAINLVYLNDVNAEAFQRYCSDHGCYFSTASSACEDNENRFRVVKAFDIEAETASHCVRLSFSKDTIKEDIDEFIRLVKEFKDKYVNVKETEE